MVWWPVLVLAVLLLGGAVSAVFEHVDFWGWNAAVGLVLGVLALGIALDLRKRR